MESTLYSKSLRKFFEYFEEDAASAKECADILVKAVPVVADDLHLGRLEICLKAPVSMYDVMGTSVEHVIYTSPLGYDTNSLQSNFETGDHGKVIIKAYPEKGYQWSQSEMESLKVFALNIFFLCGRARLIEIVETLIVTDTTTGISNLTGFMKYAYQIMVKTGLQDYHAYRFNVKNFKMVTRALEDMRAPEIFRAYGRAMERFIGGDGKLAHLGGDNFVALLKDDRTEEFLEFMSGVPLGISSLEEPVTLDARIGVYDIQPGDNISAVMEYIDTASNLAKNTNQDVVYFKAEMLDKLLHDKAILADFPRAIKEKEFVVYYQPKVNIHDNTMCGCEALVRWKAGDEIIPPMEFIPVLEENGSVCELDFYVLEQVCASIKEWIERDIKPVCVSVNFSRQHLKNSDVEDKILGIIDSYGIEHSLIEIELTEMSGYEDFDRLGKFVEKIKSNGVRTSIDDFGTGYSSLNMLTEMEVDVVKLDRTLTKCVESEYSKTKLMLLNIVDMVHKLNYKALAEGVETDEQVKFLKNIGCTMVQGFLYDMPLPREEFEKRLTGEVRYN